MDCLLFEIDRNYDRLNRQRSPKICITMDRPEDTQRGDHKNMTKVMFLEKPGRNRFGRLTRGDGFEPFEVQDDETVGGSGDQTFAFEPAQDTDHGFRGGTDHISHILSG